MGSAIAFLGQVAEAAAEFKLFYQFAQPLVAFIYGIEGVDGFVILFVLI